MPTAGREPAMTAWTLSSYSYLHKVKPVNIPACGAPQPTHTLWKEWLAVDGYGKSEGLSFSSGEVTLEDYW